MTPIIWTDEADAEERVACALTMFVFNGLVVPRTEMARAVVLALTHRNDPRVGIAKHVVVTTESGEG